MAMPTVLVATWSDGVIAIQDGDTQRELQGRSVKGLAFDGEAGALAIVDGHTLYQRGVTGAWRILAVSKSDLACSVAACGKVYAGTDNAELLRLGVSGELEALPGFAAVPGRDTWYAGTALIDGKLLGPPLGIRSMTATSNGAALLANVHVGGIPRSTDGGLTWHPTIDIEADVHEVRAHDTRPDIVAAAAATGLCISRDGGKTWSIEQEGMHSPYCSAIALTDTDVLVSASKDPFSTQGALYRRAIDGAGPLLPVGGGLPRWLDGIVDTGCIATRAAMIALVDGGGNLYVSNDSGRTWARIADQLPAPSGILIV